MTRRTRAYFLVGVVFSLLILYHFDIFSVNGLVFKGVDVNSTAAHPQDGEVRNGEIARGEGQSRISDIPHVTETSITKDEKEGSDDELVGQKLWWEATEDEPERGSSWDTDEGSSEWKTSSTLDVGRTPTPSPTLSSTTSQSTTTLSTSISSSTPSSPLSSSPPPWAPSPSITPTTDIDPSEVLLLLKTGASTIWRRLPPHILTHLSTSLLPASNILIYSDLHERLTPQFTALDILSSPATLTAIKKHDPAAYAAYLKQKSDRRVNTYREHARLPGDEAADEKAGVTEGWVLDRYKFLPMLEQAAAYGANLSSSSGKEIKWYIYIEDDTYPFMPNILDYLKQFDHTKPQYHGARSGPANATFAQGGSGIAFSSSLMSSIFSPSSPNIPSLEEYGARTAKSCCGDVMLGEVLRDRGVQVNDGGWGSVGWRPEPGWKTGWEKLLWCRRAFTFHHLHGRDLVGLEGVKEKVERESNGTRPVLFRDVFMDLVEPYMRVPLISHWDNFADSYEITSTNLQTLPSDLKVLNTTTKAASIKSATGCQDACVALPECMGWRHDLAKETCGLDRFVKLGREPDPQPVWEEKTTITSGWVLERVKRDLLSDECEVILES